MGAQRYAYLNARISILTSRITPPEQLDELVDRPGPVTGGDFGGLDEALLERARTQTGLVEHALLLRLLEDYLTVIRSLSGNERTFLAYAVRWFELSNLKSIIRGKLGGLPRDAIGEQLVDLGSFTTLPLDELLHTEDPAELLRRLETTPYADIARQARHTFEDRPDLFAVDAAIDRRYFMGLHRRALTVELAERQALMVLVGFLMDRINLMWLLRFRLSYGLSPAESYFLLIPARHRLRAGQLQAMAQLSTLEEMLSELPADVGAWVTGAETIPAVADRLDGRTRALCARVLSDTRFAIARAFGYLLLRELEMRQLLAVYKGKRLGFPAELIRYAARTGI